MTNIPHLPPAQHFLPLLSEAQGKLTISSTALESEFEEPWGRAEGALLQTWLLCSSSSHAREGNRREKTLLHVDSNMGQGFFCHFSVQPGGILCHHLAKQELATEHPQTPSRHLLPSREHTTHNRSRLQGSV